jgi:hydroxyacylglutathione hydrolase
MSLMLRAAGYVISATNPATLSLRGWFTLSVCASVIYFRHVSTLSSRPKNAPCPDHGALFRVLYGLFNTRVAEVVLGYMLHTKADEPQAEQIGGTVATIIGPRQLRIKIVPILGKAFGGNYAYLVWDERDEKRRAICVDPADPHPVMRAAAEEGLHIELLLCTHWHFDHAGGNRTMARSLPGLKARRHHPHQVSPPPPLDAAPASQECVPWPPRRWSRARRSARRCRR